MMKDNSNKFGSVMTTEKKGNSHENKNVFPSNDTIFAPAPAATVPPALADDEASTPAMTSGTNDFAGHDVAGGEDE